MGEMGSAGPKPPDPNPLKLPLSSAKGKACEKALPCHQQIKHASVKLRRVPLEVIAIELIGMIYQFLSLQPSTVPALL